jgi:hypothetical protein
MLHDLDDESRHRAHRDLRKTIQAHAGPHGIRFAAAVWLITARRGEARTPDRIDRPRRPPPHRR